MERKKRRHKDKVREKWRGNTEEIEMKQGRNREDKKRNKDEVREKLRGYKDEIKVETENIEVLPYIAF